MPQDAGVGLPQHRAGVVVGVRVERSADPRVVLVVAFPARAPQRPPGAGEARLCTCPNEGGVSVTNARGRSVTDSGTPFEPPESPARIRWNASAA